jgi:hypothetical protein
VCDGVIVCVRWCMRVCDGVCVCACDVVCVCVLDAEIPAHGLVQVHVNHGGDVMHRYATRESARWRCCCFGSVAWTDTPSVPPSQPTSRRIATRLQAIPKPVPCGFRRAGARQQSERMHAITHILILILCSSPWSVHGWPNPWSLLVCAVHASLPVPSVIQGVYCIMNCVKWVCLHLLVCLIICFLCRAVACELVHVCVEP